MIEPLVLVFGETPSERAFLPRTLRSLRQRQIEPLDVTQSSWVEIAKKIDGQTVWLIRAGAFLTSPGNLQWPPPSAREIPIGALGMTRTNPSTGQNERTTAHEELIRKTGGDFTPHKVQSLPAISSIYLERQLASRVAKRLGSGVSLELALLEEMRTEKARIVRFSPLDVFEDEALRVFLVVTSLQQGGAEKMVLDLAETLQGNGIRPKIVTLGRPTRAAFVAPEGTIELMHAKDRIQALSTICLEQGADLVHAHLLTGTELQRFAELGSPPVVVTVHNTREGWPQGYAELGPRDATLLVACSLRAEEDLAAANIPIPIRTVWNGINLEKWRPSGKLEESGRRIRKQFGFGADDLVLVVVANPRPQKRLALLAPLLAAVRRRFSAMGITRQTKLLLVGDKDPRVETAKRALDEFLAAAKNHGVFHDVHLAGSTSDVAPMLAAADALVSTSAHEGLSLAHLEALAMGLFVFATDAGGTREIAFAAPRLSVFPLDCSPETMGEEIANTLVLPREKRTFPPLRSFSRETMAQRYAALYQRALTRGLQRGSGKGVVLVTNNFSTGGAQSSARRLLLGLRDAGEYVRAVVLEEQPEWPTPGRKALLEAGIEVFALPDARSTDVVRAVRTFFRWLDADPPEVIVFWNALAAYKLLIADQCFEIAVFDVSPGEMFFASLAKYVSKPEARGNVPFRDARDYGARLAGVIVKYTGEAELARETLGAPTFVVPNGVPLPEKRAARPPGERLFLGTSARLSPQKKLAELLDAFRLALPNLPPCILLIGGGPEQGSEEYAEGLKKRAEGLPVEWLGEVAVAEMLAKIDLFVMISEPAGCPNASLEAMAEGLPVIATDFGGASEQVVDGVTGRLVARGDVSAFAAALVEMGNDPEKRALYGAASRRRIEERFDVRRMVADYRRIWFARRDQPEPRIPLQT